VSSGEGARGASDEAHRFADRRGDRAIERFNDVITLKGVERTPLHWCRSRHRGRQRSGLTTIATLIGRYNGRY
jgi:hypothetical protein